MKQGRADRRQARRQRERRAHEEGLRALERLQRERTLFEPAARRVVEAALEGAGLDGRDAPVVEIGSGGGQLRRWLPERLLPAMVHTEPEPAFVERFQQAVPQAAVQVAAAEALPFADGTVAGVLGLCVLDVVDLEAVARELHRVLKPGGCVVQLWDMAPSMRWLCEREMSDGRVLLPDCFSDPLVRAELPAALQAALPPLDFLQDLVSVPSAQLRSLIALLRPSPTDLIDGAALERLARYVSVFEPPARRGRSVAGQRRSGAGAGPAGGGRTRGVCLQAAPAQRLADVESGAWRRQAAARAAPDFVRSGPLRAPGRRSSLRPAWRSTCDVRRARALVPRPARRARPPRTNG